MILREIENDAAGTSMEIMNKYCIIITISIRISTEASGAEPQDTSLAEDGLPLQCEVAVRYINSLRCRGMR